MEDNQIIDLYFQRSEQAISETDQKYGGFCYSIAYNILGIREDAQESVSDTYLHAWNSIPPERPQIFRAFLAKVTRHLSIDRWRKDNAKKRGGGELPLALEELEACSASTPESEYLYRQTIRVYRSFLKTLPQTQRNVFLRRYFLLDSIADISRDFGFSQSKVKSILFRTRNLLRETLQKEGLL